MWPPGPSGLLPPFITAMGAFPASLKSSAVSARSRGCSNSHSSNGGPVQVLWLGQGLEPDGALGFSRSEGVTREVWLPGYFPHLLCPPTKVQGQGGTWKQDPGVGVDLLP